MASFSSPNTANVTKCIDTIRILGADMVEKANSGHAGAPMGCAPIAHLLYSEVMNYAPENPDWFNRDRFVLSNGHACALHYSMLHLTGYNISMDDLKQFRQLGSITPGHPENALTPGIEVSTGPLGQGISNAVGLAMAERHLGAVYNREGFNVVDHFTYVLCGDGCLQEGVASEACSLAGHQGLGKLIVCYDDNSITIDGDTNISFTEDVTKRFEAYGWHVQDVADGNDISSLRTAIDAAKAETSKPSLIKIRTVIGFGSAKEGTEAVHGAPLGAADIASIKEKFGFNPAEFFAVPTEVGAFYRSCGEKSAAAAQSWKQMYLGYITAFPAEAEELSRRIAGELPANWQDVLPENPVPEVKAKATRAISGDVLNALAKAVPEVVGGSADLTGSNCVGLKCTHSMQKNSADGRFVHFGVREHGMVAICNGMFAHGGVRPFCATFLNFIGYALGAVRVTALSEMGVIFVMTHDSIGLGEDGPTHQPVEMLETLRAMPNLHVMRPADCNETKGAYISAMQHTKTPTVLSLSRQATPSLTGTCAKKVLLGGYTLQEFNNGVGDLPYPTLVLVATGTEVNLALQVGAKLLERHLAGAEAAAGFWVRVVSMPCCELFDTQSDTYQLSVFPDGAPVMSIEAGGVVGWRKYAHAPFGIDRQFGLSAPGGAMLKHFGFTADNLAEQARMVIEFYRRSEQNGKLAHPHAVSLLKVPRFPTYTLPAHSK